MSDLPSPLTPPECDLRGFEWMPLWGHRMFSSSWYRAARKDGRGGIASLKLWWSAILQHPAGSLPNNEDELCMLADFGEDMRSWRKHRAVAMHGFILCCDNRWYHPMVAQQAVEAYERRLKAAQNRQTDADRLRRWRAANGSHPPEKPNGQTHLETRFETPPETRFNNHYRPAETRFETPSETRSETSRALDKTRQDKTGEYKTEESKNPSPTLPAAAGREPRGLNFGTRQDGTNPRALGTNPREAGTNPRANGTNPRKKPSRNAFHDMAREFDAAHAHPTIDAAAEEVVEFAAYQQRLRGNAYG